MGPRPVVLVAMLSISLGVSSSGIAAASKPPATVSATALATADYASTMPPIASVASASFLSGQEVVPGKDAPVAASTTVNGTCGGTLGAVAGGAGRGFSWGSGGAVLAIQAFGIPSSEKDLAAAMKGVQAAIERCPNPVIKGQASITPTTPQPKLGPVGGATAAAFRGTITSATASAPAEYVEVLLIDGQLGAYIFMLNQTGQRPSDQDLTKLAVMMDQNLQSLQKSLGAKPSNKTSKKSSNQSSGSGPKGGSSTVKGFTDPSLEAVNASGGFGAPLKSIPPTADLEVLVIPCGAYSQTAPFRGTNVLYGGSGSTFGVDHVEAGDVEAQKVMDGLGTTKPGCTFFNTFTLKSIAPVRLGDGGYRYLAQSPSGFNEYCLVRFGPRIDVVSVGLPTSDYSAAEVDKLFSMAGCTG